MMPSTQARKHVRYLSTACILRHGNTPGHKTRKYAKKAFP